MICIFNWNLTYYLHALIVFLILGTGWIPTTKSATHCHEKKKLSSTARQCLCSNKYSLVVRGCWNGRFQQKSGGKDLYNTESHIFLPLFLDIEQCQQEVTWWVIAVSQPTLPGSIAVLIRVRVWLDQLQPCGSTAMDQSDLAPAHTNKTSVQQPVI